MNNFQSKVSLIWNIAEFLRGSWKRHEYQDVVLPLTVLKRLDCVLASIKEKVLVEFNKHHDGEKQYSSTILSEFSRIRKGTEKRVSKFVGMINFKGAVCSSYGKNMAE